jgi:uncharacterized protein
MKLPSFKYHPDPISTDSICESDNKCICCGEKRGYVYIRNVYGTANIHEELCPWCIVSGKAAEKYDVVFIDYSSLVEAGLSQDVIDEVSKRTPGYTTWQGEEWLTHCNDACCFLGDAKKEVLQKLDIEQVNEIFGSNNIDKESWLDLLSYYEPGGDPAIYHFECLHCKKQIFNHDCS